MDRDAIARAYRRQQANDALEFERDRATLLQEQAEAMIAELEGPRIDEETFSRMAPEDVQTVRAVLQLDGDPEVEEDWLVVDLGPPEADAGESEEAIEEEIARLQQEAAASRQRQEAIERYLEALGG